MQTDRKLDLRLGEDDKYTRILILLKSNVELRLNNIFFTDWIWYPEPMRTREDIPTRCALIQDLYE